MNPQLFITGIGTDVGKTVCAALITEALMADYWKPIQTGYETTTDSEQIRNLISNKTSKCFPSAYNLKAPLSPHEAAALEEIYIDNNTLQRPQTNNTLVIEGAGGILVPLNDTATIFDLIYPNDWVILVLKHYLGSINHSLLSLSYLRQNGIKKAGIIINGAKNEASEKALKNRTVYPIIGYIPNIEILNKEHIYQQANLLKPFLVQFLQDNP